ncbi:hypothetical protein PAL_GLEAN10007511 [Pteropus alecto]|uniref:Uncharacterized protein n=1 Tax=Pteropus alecto TaxID=9402 RepID=L5K315_PTEAL|nr:hypothetical protein PAL_GLEAN10007511 [Pteropus alecto]
MGGPRLAEFNYTDREREETRLGPASMAAGHGRVSLSLLPELLSSALRAAPCGPYTPSLLAGRACQTNERLLTDDRFTPSHSCFLWSQPSQCLASGSNDLRTAQEATHCCQVLSEEPTSSLGPALASTQLWEPREVTRPKSFLSQGQHLRLIQEPGRRSTCS